MSCLFQSLGHLIGCDPNHLRQCLCDYLECNPDIMQGINAEKVIQWESNVNMAEYIQNMRRQATWGGAIEIAAFVDMMKMVVVVSDLRANKNITFVPKERRPRRCPKKFDACFISWNGSHYEPLKKEVVEI
jgi:hypothetical protein